MASLAKKKTDVNKKTAESAAKLSKNKKKSVKKTNGTVDPDEDTAAEDTAEVDTAEADTAEAATAGDEQQQKIEEDLQKLVYDSEEEEGEEVNGDAADSEKSKYRCKLCLHLFDTDKELSNHERTSPYHKRMLMREEEKAKGMTVYTQVKTTPVSVTKAELPKWFQVIEESMIGLEHVVEVQRWAASDLTYYICKLCGMREMPVVEHIMSRSHKIECLLEKYESQEAHILATLELTEDEKRYMTTLFKDKMYPPPAELKTVGNIQLLNRCVKVIVDKTGQEKIQVVKETADSKLRPNRQKPLTKQIRGHSDDKYPANLKSALSTTGNFGKEVQEVKKKQMGRQGQVNYQSNYNRNQPGRPGLLGDHPGRYGNAQASGANQLSQYGGRGYSGAGSGGYGGGQAPFNYGGKKMSMLEWLHGTAAKLDQSAVCVHEEYQLAQEIVSFLRNGITMFNNNEGYDEIATYPAYIESSTVSLLEWLRMTSSFMNSGWLCSPREVTMAHVVISQLSAEVEKFTQRAASAGAQYGAGRGRGTPAYTAAGGDNYGGNPAGRGGYTGGYNQQSQGYGNQQSQGYGNQQSQGYGNQQSQGYGNQQSQGYGSGLNNSQYDPYSQLDDITGDFAGMSLGRGGVPAYMRDRAMNPKTGKVYVRRPGKSHYNLDAK